ncbi:hypothetical protein M0802_004535 [Mischocyttarus mexicanus]|nr:hypothetical protein M0802_004535 [Mischocyttarus mexicanus]
MIHLEKKEEEEEYKFLYLTEFERSNRQRCRQRRGNRNQQQHQQHSNTIRVHYRSLGELYAFLSKYPTPIEWDALMARGSNPIGQTHA